MFSIVLDFPIVIFSPIFATSAIKLSSTLCPFFITAFFNLSSEGLRVRDASKIYISRPMPSGFGPLFYNRVVSIKSNLNPSLDIRGILLTMYDTRLRLSNQVVEEVKTHFQDLVFKTIIHRNVTLGESPSYGETIIIHDATSKGAINYLNLADELLQKTAVTV